MQIRCQVCGREFYATPSRIVRNKAQTCSYECGSKRRIRPLEERIWEKVKKTEGCWLWQGMKNQDGYGLICSKGHNGKPWLVHRVIWELTNGSIPDGMQVLHHCDMPACVRPEHLFLGTQADNIADMLRKGRQNLGTKLCLVEVKAIRERYTDGGMTFTGLSREYGVCRETIAKVIYGKTWKGV